MKNKIVAAAIGGLIATVVGSLIVADLPKPTDLIGDVRSWIWDGGSWIADALGSSHSIPGWAILVLVLLALVGLIALSILLVTSLQDDAHPTYRDYTEDMLDGVRWRWRWVGNKIYNLWCFCPICDAQLVYSEAISSTRLICERCPSDGSLTQIGKRGRVVATIEGGDKDYAIAAAEREVSRRIRTGER